MLNVQTINLKTALNPAVKRYRSVTMQQVQDRLEFEIDTPSDKELAKVFASRQKELTELLGASRQGEISKRLTPPNTSRNYKKRQRKNAKKRARQHA